ncbi:MAG: carboxypeptidase regulatory-like domain-containing protein [Flavisolibacter sp.]|nr:carboxypeptidase regulatory-like domain-containing protein [Flavisolibacter sp.]
MKAIFGLFYIYLMITGCCSSNNIQSLNNMQQGIKGQVAELTGNQMPSPEREPAPPKGIKTRIYIYEATSLNQVDATGSEPFYRAIRSNFIKSIVSDKNGFFATDLPPGKYSLFTKVDDLYYANSFDGNNIIAPVQVSANTISEVNIIISAKAAF